MKDSGAVDLFISDDLELCREMSSGSHRATDFVFFLSEDDADVDQIFDQGWADAVVERSRAHTTIRNVLPLVAKGSPALARREAGHLRLALDVADVGFWTLNLMTGAASRSLKHDQIFGYEQALPNWTYDQFLNDHVHPDDREGVDLVFQQAMTNEGGGEFETRIYRRDNALRWIWVRCLVLQNPSREPVEMVGLIVDITSRKQAEASLLESQRSFREMADNSPVMVWVTEPDGYCSYLNQPWYEFTGQTPEDALGFGWLEAVHEDDRKVSGDIFAAANEKQVSFRLEYRIRHKDGTYRWAIDAASPRVGEDGSFLGYIGSVIDITSRKDAEEILKENDRQKDQYLAMLAHELRNPLAGISNAAQLLGQSDHAEQRRWSQQIIENQAHHLSRMLDDLLDVSRITRGKITLQPSVIDLTEVLKSAIQTARPMLVRKGHTLVTTIASGKFTLEGDRTRLEQIFVNLINNAGKYTNSGGRIEVACEQRGGNAEITITDDGTGMSAEFLPRAFELFVQGDRTLARSEGGLGLGLTLVKTLVELHGGRVLATSPGSGLGSRFVVTLPLDLTLEMVEPQSSEPLFGKADRRLLIVDDNVDSGTGLARLLEAKGFDVSLHHGGQEGIKAAHLSRPDAMLIDLGMPGLDGYQVARTLREEGFSETLLVAVTGYGEAEARARSRDAGFDFHFVKPVKLNLLMPVLNYRSHRVLLVEDNPVILKTTSLYLSGRGFRVRTAESAEAALKEFERFCPHTILCDINLEGQLNGIDFAQLVCSSPDRPSVTLVAMSGDSSEQTRGAALKAGFKSFLTKPVRLPDLENLLRRSRT